METSAPLVFSTSISLISICSLAYFAGRFSEKISTIEKKVEKQAESATVDKDLLAIKEVLSKDLKNLSDQMNELKNELHNVRADFSDAISGIKFQPTSRT